MTFLVTTLSFLLVGLFGCLGAHVAAGNKSSTALFYVTLVQLTVISCWMLWAIVYIAQMNPLIAPIPKGEGE